MARYVDGFVIPVPRKNLASYRRMARKAGRIWREHGALSFTETVAEDLAPHGVIPFARVVKTKPREVVVFSWIMFTSRAHRDRVNAKVMVDPRMGPMMDPKAMPFDVNRMIYGGFSVLVDL